MREITGFSNLVSMCVICGESFAFSEKIVCPKCKEAVLKMRNLLKEGGTNDQP